MNNHVPNNNIFEVQHLCRNKSGWMVLSSDRSAVSWEGALEVLAKKKSYVGETYSGLFAPDTEAVGTLKWRIREIQILRGEEFQ